MKKSRVSVKPNFFWQACLILLPTAVLALVGFSFLLRDRSALEAEARARADQLARDLVQDLSSNWTSKENFEYSFETDALWLIQGGNSRARRFEGQVILEIDRDARLVYPPEFSPWPEPQPLALDVLSGQQRAIWQQAATAEHRDRNWAGVEDAYREFLALEPPARFGGLARIALANALKQQGQSQRAFDVLAQEPHNLFGERSESGVPLAHLADLRLLELARSVDQLDATRFTGAFEVICSNAVAQPSLLTPALLESARELERERSLGTTAAQGWTKIWENHERSRRSFAVVRSELQRRLDLRSSNTTDVRSNPSSENDIAPQGGSSLLPRCFWAGPARQLLVLRLAEKNGRCRVAVRDKQEAWNFLKSDWIDGKLRALPPYYGLTIALGGEDIYRHALPPAAELERLPNWHPFKAPVFSTAMASEQGVETLRASIHLLDAGALYSEHRRRVWWFGLILASAFGACFIGWLTTRRAFTRQVRLNEMKSDFVSSVSHELRAPIASVRLMAEGLESGRIQDSAKRQQYFKFIVQECRRLTALIENVLDFARIDQGRKEYEFEPTEINSLVQQTAKLMEPYANDRAVRLDLAIEEGANSGAAVQPVLDGRAVQQALVNLIDNAIKHSPRNSSVTIGWGWNAPIASDSRSKSEALRDHRAANEFEPAVLQLWVEDHGQGIPPEEHERIFERFYRVGSELRRETEGVGIGLSIVKHIVEAHRGKVSVRSAPGQGSRFTMEFPAVPQPSNGN